jgi:hypothetical protein
VAVAVEVVSGRLGWSCSRIYISPDRGYAWGGGWGLSLVVLWPEALGGGEGNRRAFRRVVGRILDGAIDRRILGG